MSYVFARYYNVSDELSPAKSLVDTVLSQLGKYQKYWSVGQKTLKQLGVEKITGSQQAAFVSDMKTLISS